MQFFQSRISTDSTTEPEKVGFRNSEIGPSLTILQSRPGLGVFELPLQLNPPI